MIEVRMSRELAEKLGCLVPESLRQHREWDARGGFLKVRDPRTMVALFWPLIPNADLSRS